MQRRRGNTSGNTDVDETNGIYHMPSSSARRRRRHTNNTTHYQNGRINNKIESISFINVAFDNVCLLSFIFMLWLYISFVIYEKFDVTPTTTPPSIIDIHKISIDHKKYAQDVHQNRANIDDTKPSPSPTKRPTITLKDQTETYEPTGHGKRWRLKEAKILSRQNTEYWKTNKPDAVPPLPSPNNNANNSDEDLPPVIAYVTTLTKCAPKHRGGLDGAAVLLHSIRRNSFGWVPIDEQMTNSNNNNNAEQQTNRPQYGGIGGRYRYAAYVIVDPAASPNNKRKSGECARFLQKIGWTILHRPPLVPLFPLDDDRGNDIFNSNNTLSKESETYQQLVQAGYLGIHRPPESLRKGERPDKLRLMMHNDGCCGYTELLKLHVYGLVEHKLAVHLDFDSLILRPMDDLFDAMLGVGDESTRRRLPIAKLPKTKDVDFTKPIDAAFTRDYNSVINPKLEAPVGYQGGFLVVKPSLTVLDRYRTEILQRGNFLLGPRDGWAGKHGGFYGDVTFQGILPYYYEDIAPKGEHNEVELDRCVYNQMADNPRKSTYKFPRATPLDPKEMGFSDTKFCRDGRKDCSDTDCQRTHPKDSITTHFTFCKKPWDCSEGNVGTVAMPTCLGLLKEWYGIRRELEDWWLIPPSSSVDNKGAHYWKDNTISKVLESRKGTLDNTQYFGYCDKAGTEGYHRLVEPDEPKH